MQKLKSFYSILLVLAIFSCSDISTVKRETAKSVPQNSKSPFMKAHMPNGDVYIFDGWKVDEPNRVISGNGVKQNFNRDVLETRNFSLPIDSVSLFETNVKEVSPIMSGMTVLTGISVAGTVLCLTNPKACFGSCPTFYIDRNGKEYLQAEGFSSSISPSLEAADVDALYFANPKSIEFKIEMKNEALETHVVRHANLILVPKSKERSIQDVSGKYWQTEKLIFPQTATSSEGDILKLVSELDGNERYSLSDESNLKSDEFINLEFQVTHGKEYGLVVAGRQTLLTTFLLYQAYSYMGNDYGRWLNMLEQNNRLFSEVDPSRFLGGIEIQELNMLGFWSTSGEIHEFGPLATDLHMVNIGKNNDATRKIRLKLNKGNWRIDYIALAELGKTVDPKIIHPSLVLKENSENPEALVKLTDESKSLTTLPGDSYTLVYHLPDNYLEYSFYLESKGYYLEWMRDEWAKEENADKLVQMILSPSKTLKELAPKYKELEPSMEKVFWNSKYAH